MPPYKSSFGTLISKTRYLNLGKDSLCHVHMDKSLLDFKTEYGGNARSGVHLIETITVVIGCGTAALFLAHALWVVNKMQKLDCWRAGSTDSYTKEVSSAHAAPPNKPKVKAATEFVD